MLKQAIVIRTDLNMGKGKIAAQASHASVEAFFESTKKAPDKADEWLSEGQKKIVLKVKTEKELRELFMKAKDKRIICAIIRDAGYTQIEAGSMTGLAIGPDEDSKIDAICGKLKLL